MSSLFKGSSAHVLKDQELNIKDIATRLRENIMFYIVLRVCYIVGNSLPRPKRAPCLFSPTKKGRASKGTMHFPVLLQFILNKNYKQLFSLLRNLVMLSMIVFNSSAVCSHKCHITITIQR